MNLQQARKTMVDTQVRPNGVTDSRIITALLDIPRERFVPESWRAMAYSDARPPVAAGRSLLAPTVLAKLLQTADISAEDVVLDVGCATGYSTAVISRLAAFVVGLEADEAMSAAAGENLAAVDATSAVIVAGPLDQGYAASAPYDVIVVEGAVIREPSELLAQLKDGGRLVAIVGEGGSAKATIFLKTGEAVSQRAVFDAWADVLPGFEAVPSFVF